MSTEPVPCAAGCATRRAVLAAAGAVGAVGVAAALTGCQTYGKEAAAPPPEPPAPAPTRSKPQAAGATRPPAEPPAPPPPPAAPALAKVSDIPVGGGKIFADKNVVVTQPKAGTIKAFSATCTHAGCPVSEVDGGTINCNCHGSRFKIADGSVADGPAGSSLDAVRVKVSGGAIRLA